MFGWGGLISESMDLAAHEMHSSLAFVVQGLVRYGNGESMTSLFFVPSVICQLPYMKSLVDEKTFQIQNEAEIIL